MTLNQTALEKAARACSRPLANMTGGCFKPDNGRSDRGDCADGDCYCARVSHHCATATITTYITELSKTHVLVPRELDDTGWSDLVDPIAKRLEIASKMNMEFVHNKDGAMATATLMRKMAHALDAALIAEIDAREKGDG